MPEISRSSDQEGFIPSSSYGAHQVRAKTSEVKDYHYDDSRPGKPLYLLIPGGLIALASLLLIIAILLQNLVR